MKYKKDKQKRSLKSTINKALCVGIACTLINISPVYGQTLESLIVINGKQIVFDEAMGKPVSIEGRMYVPIRVMTEALGYQTDWHDKKQIVKVEGQGTSIELEIGNPKALVNGQESYIDVREGQNIVSTSANLIGGRTYVPLRFITETLGCEVRFEEGVTYITQKVVSDKSISPCVYQKKLGRGMDVDWSKTSQGRIYYNEQTVKDFKAAGISHVRIRVKDPADEVLFEALDQQIEDCLSNGVIPIIAYQADEFKNDPSEANIEKVVQWWGKVAERYKEVSPLLSFDLLIEATDALNKQSEKLNEIYERLVSEIRKTNPTRIIMISPRLRSDAAYLHELKVPSQHNGYLMAEWHFYASGPSKTNNRKLWTVGTPEEKALIQEKIDLAKQWQEVTGIPTWVGAWMPGNYNDGNDYSINEQVVFAEYMTQQLMEADIPFAVNSDTKFYNRETNQWVQEMLPVRQMIFNQK